ncbi:Macrophage colony-stimulating factor 1 receptor [Elasticomyces elasticus]|nr:Macrophage colony-stimulating factor 1 receptor [Elasticomyces elasticus]
MASGTLFAQPLGPRTTFNWVFLVELLVCGILALFFLFYFNRLFATIIGYTVRAYTWHKFRAYIDITALQISLLGGRIFFKSIRYHGHNETILVRDGHITWRYWLARVEEAEIFKEDSRGQTSSSSEDTRGSNEKPTSRNRSIGREEKGHSRATKPLPCRVSVKVSGVEAFLYNRSPAYDSIVDHMSKGAAEHDPPASSQAAPAAASTIHRKPSHPADDDKPNEKRIAGVEIRDSVRRLSKQVSSMARHSSGYEHPKELPVFLRWLPVNVECKKAAAVLGNEHTRTVLTAKLDHARGTIDAGKAGIHDVYKLLFGFEFDHIVVAMKPNADFKMPQLVAAARAKEGDDETKPQAARKKRRKLPFRSVRKLVHTIKSLLPQRSSRSVRTVSSRSESDTPRTKLDDLPGQHQWQGLARYLDESQHDEHEEWDNVEYARASTIADCEKVGIKFYWDIPGMIPENWSRADEDSINGSPPPDYGMDLAVHGGLINYGPWADRQRVNLQQIFFPASYADYQPGKLLLPGEQRVSSNFKLFLSLEKEVTLRIPMRESSKDWQWQGRAGSGKEKARHDATKSQKGHQGHGRRFGLGRKRDQSAQGPDVRPFAWLDIKVPANSTVNYVMDMIAGRTGFANHLDLDLPNTEIASSVNHGLLWRTGRVTMDGDLSNPLRWNSLRKWLFEAIIDDLELFILRDHMFLVTDLVADWASGPPPDFFTFIPFHYALDLTFRKFKLYLNSNDANIINNPADMDDNNFLVLYGNELHADLGIPIDKFRPIRNEITFDVHGHRLGLENSNPSRVTLDTFLKEKNVADLGKVTLTGSHSYYTESRPDLTDILRMDIHGTDFTLVLYGFLIRYFMNVKENYFGENLHFKTQEEFQGTTNSIALPDKQEGPGGPSEQANDLDVILCIVTERATALIPANLYSSKHGMKIDIATASADLRFTNYYMDLMVNFSPLGLTHYWPNIHPDSPTGNSSGTQIFIDGVDLFGHRLFGLAPAEPTYVCNWDIDIGGISGECSSAFLQEAVGIARVFAFSLDDDENALPIGQTAVIHDITFLRLKTDLVKIWLHAGKEALLLSNDPIGVDYNDWAGSNFSERLQVSLPNFTLACVDGDSAARRRGQGSRSQTVDTFALLCTSINMNMMQRKLHFAEERRKQQGHIRYHDQRTARTHFLLLDQINPILPILSGSTDVKPSAMPFPMLPNPLTVQDLTSQAFRPLPRTSQPSLSSQSSLLSDSSIESVLHSQEASKEIRKPVMFETVSSTADATVPATSSGEIQQEQHNYPQAKRNLASAFARPHFALDGVEPDWTNTPTQFRQPEHQSASAVNTFVFDDLGVQENESHTVHTSLIVCLKPGLRILLDVRAVHAAAALLDLVQPKQPEAVLDDYQVRVLTVISERQQRRKGLGKKLDLHVRLPFTQIRALNEYGRKDDRALQDVIDITLDFAKLTLRSHAPSGNSTAVPSQAAHLAVESLSLSLTNKRETETAVEDAVHASLNDFLIWFALSRTKSIHVAFKECLVATASHQAGYLACLIPRNIALAEHYGRTFSERVDRQQKLLQFLVYNLTILGGEIPDPAFLTRMTFVLRAYPDHYRNQDSWKVLSRFRYILQQVSDEARHKLAVQCSDAPHCPTDACARVLASWDQWRTWDLTHVNDSVAFKVLYNLDGQSADVTEPGEIPLGLTVRSATIGFILDPGPTQNQVLVAGLTVGLSITPPTVPTGLMLLNENQSRKIVLQAHSASTNLQLSWEISNQVMLFVEAFQDLQRAPIMNTQNEPKSYVSEDAGTIIQHEYHFVVSTEEGLISLESISIRHVSKSRNVKMSIIGTSSDLPRTPLVISMIANAELALTELWSRSRLVWRTTLDSPTLDLDYDRAVHSQQASANLSIAAAYKELTITVKEQILGLLSIIDSVVVHEVAHIQKVSNRFTRAARLSSNPKESSSMGTSPNLHVSLLAGSYRFDLALLHCLSYSVTGTVSGVRVSPNLKHSSSFDVDFDIAGHTHSIVSCEADKKTVMAALPVPPINGRVNIHLADEEITVNAWTTIEQITIEAAAIHNIMTTVRRPEIRHVVSGIRDEVTIIKTHVKNIMPESSGAKALHKMDDSKPVVYDVRAALLGLKISAIAPGAELDLRVGTMHTIVTNRVAHGVALLKHPDVRSVLQRINLSLEIVERHGRRPCGNITLGASVHATSHDNDSLVSVRDFRARSSALEVNLYADTASTIVDVINHLQDRIRELDLSKEIEYLKHLRESRKKAVVRHAAAMPKTSIDVESDELSNDLFSASYMLDLQKLQVSWIVGKSVKAPQGYEIQDLVLSLSRVNFSTRKENEAKLIIENLQLQAVPASKDKSKRSVNSALLPEIVFSVGHWSSKEDRRLFFSAAGKALDLCLESQFILPVKILHQSISLAIGKFQTACASWEVVPTSSGAPRNRVFGKKKLSSLRAEVNFAGAVVYLQGKAVSGHRSSTLGLLSQIQSGHNQHGRYGQFAADGAVMSTTLQAPGIALKIDYTDAGGDPSLNGELKVNASANTLHPNVVPLVLQISESVKEVVQDSDEGTSKVEVKPKITKPPETSTRIGVDSSTIITADPSAILGKTKLNLGLRICRQEFGLSCQPIAKVAANAQMEDIYVTVNTIESTEQGHFYALSAAFTQFQASVRHVYSRESTFSFDVKSIVLSMMNSKHISGTSGISAILKVDPMKAQINAKQLQDFLLFREIWIPPEIRKPSQATPTPPATDGDEYLVQRYHQVASAAAFPWNATVAIAALAVDLDLGQSIGKSSFMIRDLWASSRKSSSQEQNLCAGIEEMSVKSSGRMSGFIELQKLGVRTSIRWPQEETYVRKTPFIQASLGFQSLQAKAAFDYQAFAFADIAAFDFLMYNVRDHTESRDRLVAVVDGDKVFVFCTSTSSAQAVGLYQAFDRLIQEKQSAYEQSLRDIERFLRRESTRVPTRFGPAVPDSPAQERYPSKTPISLHTDVVVTLRSINVGAFPGTFFASQIFKLEASDVQARFAVSLENGQIHSALGMTLGQLQVALAAVKRTGVPKTLGDITVEEVVSNATMAKGGTILRVPRVVASMRTWQVPNTNHIDYIFKSSFEGKVDVGWNYSRISFIRSMWNTHCRSLASRLGKPLPESAVKITAGPEKEESLICEGQEQPAPGEQGKITAVVNIAQSRYEYRALEPPIIETPQLRDMGEATPPLEWIGLHRDRLPHVTHQIVITALLELAKEVEDAYVKILGSS